MSTEINRRKVLKLGVGSAILALLAAAGYEFIQQRKESSWPADQEGILNRIRELQFTPGSELRTTLFFRKMMWEDAQLQKMNGTWSGGDESDWMNHNETIDSHLAAISRAGFAGGRLVVVPFELTNDGKAYDWTPFDRALELMGKHHLKADLCAGPLDYPYGPSGIRIPAALQQLVQDEFIDRNQDHITVSLEKDETMPESSVKVTNYALGFLEALLKKYGNDDRIDKVYIGNEWPDTHLIEGVDGTMSIGTDFMQECIGIAQSLTNKQITLNTNIHPSDSKKLKTVFDPLFSRLGDQGVLGIDAYPTQEAKITRLAQQNERYGELIGGVREIFPETNLIFTELQAEPWPEEGAGNSWSALYTNYAEEVILPYFQETFPPTLENHVIASGIQEIGLWGAPLWLVSDQLEYDFPLEMMSIISQTMAKAG